MARDAGQEAVNVAGALTSMGIDEMISNLAVGIAKGQLALDQSSMEIAKFMGDAQIAFGKKAGTDIPDLVSLIELGFTPNFYQFVDTILEMRVSVKTSYEEKRETSTKQRDIHQDSLERNAKHQRKYSRKNSGKKSASSSSRGRSYKRSIWGGAYKNRSSANSSRSDSGISSAYSNKRTNTSSAKKKNISISTVDAKFSAKYQYSVEASSTIKTKIVPIPPPEVFEEIIRANIEKRKDREQRFLWTQQIKTFVPALKQLSKVIYEKKGDNETGLLTKLSMGADTVEDLKKLKDTRKNLKGLVTKYTQLTDDHWAIIDNILSECYIV